MFSMQELAIQEHTQEHKHYGTNRQYNGKLLI